MPFSLYPSAPIPPRLHTICDRRMQAPSVLHIADLVRTIPLMHCPLMMAREVCFFVRRRRFDGSRGRNGRALLHLHGDFLPPCLRCSTSAVIAIGAEPGCEEKEDQDSQLACCHPKRRSGWQSPLHLKAKTADLGLCRVSVGVAKKEWPTC
ncbi:hypothetical protein VTK56DRAFT_5072 [Thermocarpiscus australiensis]